MTFSWGLPYFVDLMKYIDDNLRNQFTASTPPNPLDLYVRRPDLWALELSCDNTNNLVPTLDIVDQILENHIALRVQPSLSLVDLADRAKIGGIVYEQTLTQASVVSSFEQPFHLPLARIGSYLPRLGSSLAAVADAVAAPPLTRAQAELGLRPSELAIVTTPTSDLGQLSQMYGVSFTQTGLAVDRVDAALLGRAMGLSRADLGRTVVASFVGAGGATVAIVAAKRDASSVQNDVEGVTGLTVDALDRMHRFTRLVRKTGWAVADLDLVVTALGGTTLGKPEDLEAIAQLRVLQGRFSLTVGDLCALVGLIPQTPAGTSHFDRLFNAPSYVALSGPLPQATTKFLLPAFQQSAALDTTSAQMLPRLLAGLVVDVGGLETLVRRLAGHLAGATSGGFDPDDLNLDNRYFMLSADNLTLLYRHARLARLLGVAIDDLFQLLGFLGLDHIGASPPTPPPAGWPATLADLLPLLDLQAWWRHSGYSLDDIALAIGHTPRNPTAYPDPGVVAAQVVAAAAKALTFMSTVFSVALGTTEQGSRDLLTNLSTNSSPLLVQQSPTDGSWSLIPGVDLAGPVAMTIPPTATVTTPATAAASATTSPVTAAAVLGALQPYLASEVLEHTLGAALNFTTDKVVALAALAGQTLTAAAVAKVVRGDTPVNRPLPEPPPANPPPPDALTMLIAAVWPLAVVFAAPVWNAVSAIPGGVPAPIDFVRVNPQVFGPGPLPQTDAQHPDAPHVTLAQLRALSTYAGFARRQLAASPPGDPADLQSILASFVAPAGFPPSSDAAMARVLGGSVGLVVGLRGPVALPANAAPALDQLDQAAQLALTLRIDGATLGALASNDYDALSSAADALVLALSTRYADPTTRASQLAKAEQPIREAKRDALADYLIHSVKDPYGQPIWGALDDLYQYFLIDVSAGGCSTTSWVVSATMTAQLYVYRAIMNLEQNKNHFILRLEAEAAEEWEWRKNYRVWQANREVFLWPENYLDPDLRDDMTPLFQELQSQLLQTDLSDQNVLDAYTTYLAGFDQVASLTIAGAYHQVLHSGQATPDAIHDVLHLFGATADDPPIYYYRTCHNLLAKGHDVNTAAVWSAWQKISVPITGRKVSPIVHLGRLRVFWVDIKTRSTNRVTAGTSHFGGYQHKMSLKFTTLRADGIWTPPQEVQLPVDDHFGPTAGQIADPLIDGRAQLDPQWRKQPEALDDYTLSGPNWDWAWARSSSALEIQFRNFMERVDIDLFRRKTLVPAGFAATVSARRYLCAKNTAPAEAAAEAIAAARTAADDAAGINLKADEQAVGKDSRDPVKGAVDAARLLADTTAVGLATTTAAAVPPAVAAAAASKANKALCFGTSTWMPFPDPAFANAVIDEARLDVIELDWRGIKQHFLNGFNAHQIASIPADTMLLAMPGSEEDGLLQVGNDILLLQGSVTDDAGYVLRRLGTTLAEEVAKGLFEDGLDGLLGSVASSGSPKQLQLAEGGLPIVLVGGSINTDHFNGALPGRAGKLDFTGPYGVYYRELFFHIPFLIANALNSRCRFEAAQQWYHYVFDPTAAEKIDANGVPTSDRAHRLLDRVWRYREFRGLDLETLSGILTDPITIARYKDDPFNPWAIARGRISAFQKAIVMKYVANLLDWADSLFSQFTMESVNEALMLYMMASDVLGPRPAELGDCGTGIEPDTYQTIGPLIGTSSEFLVELETWTLGARASSIATQATPAPIYTPAPNGIGHAIQRFPFVSDAVAPVVGSAVHDAEAVAREVATNPAAPAPSAATAGFFRGLGWTQTRTASWGPALGNATTKTAGPAGGRSFKPALKPGFPARAGGFGASITRQFAAFCVPSNGELLAYWDRVDDRLYKIRHCMSISGELHQLALFAPPIDPMQLVAMKAAGLSLDDVLGGGNGDLPPYRFLYLIERAKAYAATLSGFGSGLLSALEKKDGEELNRLRLTQQLNLTQAMSQARQMEIDAANAAYNAVTQQLESAQYRSDYYAGLISEDRNAWEITESVARHTATVFGNGENIQMLAASVLGLLPQIGSPFAMKFGGVELFHSMSGNAKAASALAKVADAVAVSAGLEGNFARRADGWKNQKQLADNDVKALTQQQSAAQIRVNITTNALALHQQSLGQMQDFLERMVGKFTSLGLYTWLSATLQTLYRGAYQNALALANLAQHAFQFERDDVAPPVVVASSYWTSSYSGLLAGERLLIDLQTLERRFIETNYRTLEVDQAFALSQIDAGALIDLRETGECAFTVNEVFFDLFYPGHYKRRIKAVRLTIPCITGPYVNVSASLDLVGSQIRTTPSAALVDVAPTRSVSIATSTAQNDAGVFELSFRDERYMPFEGLGAVGSQWHLTLPKSFRQFDYQSINDAILSISYTAEQDGVLRQQVEGQNKSMESTIVTYFSDPNTPARRLFSLRQDFSSAFARLLRSPAGAPGVKIELGDKHFPLFVRGRTIKVKTAVLLLRTAPSATLGAFSITLDSATTLGPAPNAFTPATPPSPSNQNPAYGGLPFCDKFVPEGDPRGEHTWVINAGGGLAPTSPPPGDVSAVDPLKLLDVLLYLEYHLA